MHESLGHQLAAAFSRTAPPEKSEPPVVLTLASGLRRIRAGVGVEMPSEADIGQVYLVRFPHDKKSTGDRVKHPVVIWGIYRDKTDRIKAVDIVVPTIKPAAQFFSSDIEYGESELHLFQSNRPGRISLNNVYTLPWTSVDDDGVFYDHTGCLGTIDPVVAPQMIVRRFDALAFTPNPQHFKSAAPHGDCTYEGLSFSGMTQASNGSVPPELSTQHVRLDKPFMGQDQEAVDRLVHWAKNYRTSNRLDGLKTFYPGATVAVEKWPGWKVYGDFFFDVEQVHKEIEAADALYRAP